MRKLFLLFAFAGACFAQSRNDCFGAETRIVNFTGTSGTAVPTQGGSKIRVCKIYLTATAATTLKLTSIGGSTTDVTGGMQAATVWQAEKVDGAFATKAGESLGIASSVSTTVSGSIVFYREY